MVTCGPTSEGVEEASPTKSAITTCGSCRLGNVSELESLSVGDGGSRSIAIASIGLITRDGLLVLAGLVLGVVWVSLLVVGFTFFGAAFIDVLKTLILGMFGAGG